jgi:hypothetical protein
LSSATGRRGRFLLEQRLLALQIVLGRDHVGLGLALVAGGGSDVGRLQRRERVTLLHLGAERCGDVDDPPRHGRKNVTGTQVVERDATARQNRVVGGLFLRGLHVDVGRLDLFVGEPHLAGRRVRGRRSTKVMTRRQSERQKDEVASIPHD